MSRHTPMHDPERSDPCDSPVTRTSSSEDDDISIKLNESMRGKESTATIVVDDSSPAERELAHGHQETSWISRVVGLLKRVGLLSTTRDADYRPGQAQTPRPWKETFVGLTRLNLALSCTDVWTTATDWAVVWHLVSFRRGLEHHSLSRYPCRLGQATRRKLGGSAFSLYRRLYSHSQSLHEICRLSGSDSDVVETLVTGRESCQTALGLACWDQYSRRTHGRTKYGMVGPRLCGCYIALAEALADIARQIFATIVVIDGPLLQRASSVMSAPIVDRTAELKMSMVPEIPTGELYCKASASTPH